MQVFLNLARNSERAMDDRSRRELEIATNENRDSILVSFRDTGCGVVNPERLFKPFQPGAQETGLGLYLSRSLLRSFGGDLSYHPELDGSTFTVKLLPAPSAYTKEHVSSTHSDFAGGRSPVISRESGSIA
jgi:two-component system sensor kinase FixL